MSITAFIKQSTSLKASLFGVQRQIRRGFGLNRFVFSMHNNPKQGIRALNNQSTDYPYGWFKINTFGLNREFIANAKNIGRAGSGYAIGKEPTNATVVRNYYLPVALSGSLYIKFMDMEQSLLFIQQMLIAHATEMLGFELEMPTTKWTVRFLIEGDSIPFPNIEDLDDGSTPGSFELEIPFTIQTKIGFNLDTAKINNYGEITVNTQLDTGEADFDPEQAETSSSEPYED